MNSIKIMGNNTWTGLRGWLRGVSPPHPLRTKLSILQSKVLLYINNYNIISLMVIDEYGIYLIYFFNK
jgi:hypothetical protein